MRNYFAALAIRPEDEIPERTRHAEIALAATMMGRVMPPHERDVAVEFRAIAVMISDMHDAIGEIAEDHAGSER